MFLKTNSKQAMYPIACFFLLLSCNNLKSNSDTTQTNTSSSNAQVEDMGDFIAIYKTNKDYYYNVPVQLSEDKKTITSYPSVSDLYINGEALYPLKLKEDYLLSRTGVGKNYVFLDYTFEEYKKLKEINPNELFKHIKDFNPFIELYECYNHGNLYDLNEKITAKQLKEICN